METPAELTMGHSTFTPNAGTPRADAGRAFVFGLLLGALIALLWAPKTGEEAREQLAEWYTLLRERLVGAMTGEGDRPEMAAPETF